MEELTQHLPTDRRHPRLWFERLVIFSEPDEAHVVRTVPFHRGLNLVWAKEPAVGRAHGTRAAGHGVGKTSLCLLLRFCLGEPSKAVTELRDELFGEFAQGGVIAVLHVDGQPFTLCRYFNAHKEGVACAGDDTADIWTRITESSDRAFLKKLASDMMSPVSPPNIPETGQAIEWKHVLAWISRDQGSRFKSFFSWREGEGTGLQRGRQDPPIVMRSVLGLLDHAESQLMGRIATLEQDLEQAKQKTAELLQEPVLIKRRIESSLRAPGNLPSDLPIRANDLFGDSVEQRIKSATEKSAAVLEQWESRHDEAVQAVADLRATLKLVKEERARAQGQYDLADAGRRKDEAAFRSIGSQLAKLTQLAGHCEEGNLPFSQCRHIQEEMNRLQFSNLRDARDRKSLEQAMAESAGRASAALARVNDLDKKIAALAENEKSLDATRKRIGFAKRTAETEANKWPGLLEELERWERSAGSTEAQIAIDASLERSAQIEQELNSARTRLAVLQQDRSEREKALAHITDGLTRQLLPDGAFGSFDPRDENRPFRLSLRGGEAYRVLEVLLGDVACMLDSPRSESALPGLVIHDCPREADMSTGLYENFLLLIDALQKGQYADHEKPFQYIVTTTTPPPPTLQGDLVCLTLDPSSDDGLLFGRRFAGERQAQIA
ncbi:hypothetical protein P3W85_00350 [Cupriavidus basilensis]|uniref:Uncharacterized protein n=1 Tax=Cupriavidus basilensis TaxID=68895 RepID=A0ABT6AFP3_9BURK|nr:hypothetical protein [Cupriavidus basilensis]MDF3831419.1 hypothetical protein [Cupriavidus basilensis]